MKYIIWPALLVMSVVNTVAYVLLASVFFASSIQMYIVCAAIALINSYFYTLSYRRIFE